MPRIKPLTQEDEKNRKLAAAIAGAMAYEGKGNKQMAETMGMTYPTWMSRMKNPGKFTVEELRKIRRILPGLEIAL